jgi:hypothetical protein
MEFPIEEKMCKEPDTDERDKYADAPKEGCVFFVPPVVLGWRCLSGGKG